MVNFSLLINGKRADYSERQDFPLTLSRDSVNATDINKRGGDRTYTIKLPLTATNRRLLGVALADPQTNARFFTSETYRVDLSVGGVNVLINARLYVTEITQDEISGYVIGSNIDFANTFRARSLRDIQSFNSLPFDGIGTINTVNSFANFTDPVYLHSEQYDVIFPLAFYLNPFLPNRWTSGRFLSQTKYVSGAGGFNAKGEITLPPGQEIFGLSTYRLGENDNQGNAHLSFQDYPPAIYLRNVIKKMFEDVGYTAVGRWLDDNETRKLVMLFTGDRPPQWNWNYLATLEIAATPTAPTDTLDFGAGTSPQILASPTSGGFTFGVINPVSNITFDPLPILQNNSFNFIYDETFTTLAADVFDSYYAAPISGRYRVSIDFAGDTVNTAATNFNTYFVLVRNSIENASDPRYADILSSVAAPNITFNPDRVIHVFSPLALNTPNQTLTEAVEVDLNANDFISLVAVTLSPLLGLSEVTNVTVFEYSVECVSSTDELEVAPNLPDINQLEFFQELVRVFNLYFDVDEVNRIVLIDSYDTFFEDPNFAVDLSGSVEPNDIKLLFNNQAKQYDFKWLPDSDFLTVDRGTDYDAQLVNPTAIAQGSQVVEPKIFASTEFDSFQVVEDTAATFLTPVFETRATLSCPFITTKEKFFDRQNNGVQTGDDFNFKPRIVKLKENVSFSPAYFNQRYWDLSQAVGARDVYVQADNYVRCVFAEIEPYPTGNPRTWSLAWSGRGGLLYLGYENFIRNLQEGELAEVNARLNAYQYGLLTLRKLVRIRNRVYRVARIQNFNPLNPGVTRLVLIRYV